MHFILKWVGTWLHGPVYIRYVPCSFLYFFESVQYTISNSLWNKVSMNKQENKLITPCKKLMYRQQQNGIHDRNQEMNDA